MRLSFVMMLLLGLGGCASSQGTKPTDSQPAEHMLAAYGHWESSVATLTPQQKEAHLGELETLAGCGVAQLPDDIRGRVADNLTDGYLGQGLYADALRCELLRGQDVDRGRAWSRLYIAARAGDREYFANHAIADTPLAKAISESIFFAGTDQWGDVEFAMPLSVKADAPPEDWFWAHYLRAMACDIGGDENQAYNEMLACQRGRVTPIGQLAFEFYKWQAEVFEERGDTPAAIKAWQGAADCVPTFGDAKRAAALTDESNRRISSLQGRREWRRGSRSSRSATSSSAPASSPASAATQP